MRYENPLYMAEEAAAADLISGGRLQLGISRGSPEPALNGAANFGYVPQPGETDADMARRHTELFLQAISGAGIAEANTQFTGGFTGKLPIYPHSPGLIDRIWWGSGSRATGVTTAQQGLNLMSSTLLIEETGVPFDQLQAEQIAQFRAAWAEAGHERTPRVSVSRSVVPILDEYDQHLFGGGRSGMSSEDQVGVLECTLSRFGKNYLGTPAQLAEELANDAAVQAADTLLLTVPNQLGVDYNVSRLETILKEVAPAIGWGKKW